MSYLQFLGLLIGLRFAKIYIFGCKVEYDPDRTTKDSVTNLCITLLTLWFSYALLKYNLPVVIELAKQYL